MSSAKKMDWWFQVLESGPAQLFVHHLLGVFSFGENAPVNRRLQALGFEFLSGLQIIEPP